MKAMIVLKIKNDFKHIYKNRGNANAWFADIASKSWENFILFAVREGAETMIIVNGNNLDVLFELSELSLTQKTGI